MARDTITVTNVFQQIAVGVVAVTVTKEGAGTLIFNEVSSDTNANLSHPKKNEQFRQDETKDTFVRSDGTGWVILVDGVLS